MDEKDKEIEALKARIAELEKEKEIASLKAKVAELEKKPSISKKEMVHIANSKDLKGEKRETIQLEKAPETEEYKALKEAQDKSKNIKVNDEAPDILSRFCNTKGESFFDY
jgi:hypothetical protein